MKIGELGGLVSVLEYHLIKYERYFVPSWPHFSLITISVILFCQQPLPQSPTLFILAIKPNLMPTPLIHTKSTRTPRQTHTRNHLPSSTNHTPL
jgi:hypothetical protein